MPVSDQLTSWPLTFAFDQDPAPDPLRGDPMSPEVLSVVYLIRPAGVDRGPWGPSRVASVDVAVDSSQ